MAKEVLYGHFVLFWVVASHSPVLLVPFCLKGGGGEGEEEKKTHFLGSTAYLEFPAEEKERLFQTYYDVCAYISRNQPSRNPRADQASFFLDPVWLVERRAIGWESPGGCYDTMRTLNKLREKLKNVPAIGSYFL